MANCGCDTGALCACAFEAGPGITLTGFGSVNNPIIISANIDAATCDKITTCVGAHLGTGFVPATIPITAENSALAGNTTTIDGTGVTTLGCTGCPRPVTFDDVTILQPGCIIGSTHDMTAPHSERSQRDLAFALWRRVQIWDFEVERAMDGTFWVSPGSFSQWNASYNSAGFANVRVDTMDAPMINLVDWAPPENMPSAHPKFYANPLPRYPMSFPQVLSQLGGKVLLSFRFSGDEFDPALPGMVDDLWRLVDDQGLGRSIMFHGGRAPGTGGGGDQTIIANTWAGNSGMVMFDLYGTAYVGDPFYSPDSLVARGWTWVLLSENAQEDGVFLTEAQIRLYTDDPRLTVIGRQDNPSWSSQNAVIRERNFGYDGWIGGDGVWASGPCTNYSYRSTTSPYQHKRFWPGVHNLTEQRDRGYFRTISVLDPAGAHLDTFHVLPQLSDVAVLQGWGCPVPNPNNILIQGVTNVSNTTPTPDDPFLNPVP